MTAVTLGASTPERERRDVLARLGTWREHLLQRKAGVSNCVLTLPEIRAALDVLLDELLELRGR